jgi:hypothetical protein
VQVALDRAASFWDWLKSQPRQTHAAVLATVTQMIRHCEARRPERTDGDTAFAEQVFRVSGPPKIAAVLRQTTSEERLQIAFIIQGWGENFVSEVSSGRCSSISGFGTVPARNDRSGSASPSEQHVTHERRSRGLPPR